jgi:hypothetical protein
MELRRFLIAFAVIRKLRVIFMAGRGLVEVRAASAWCMRRSSCLCGFLVRLHKVAMHDNTEGMGRISTHTHRSPLEFCDGLIVEVKSGSGTDTRQMVV